LVTIVFISLHQVATWCFWLGVHSTSFSASWLGLLSQFYTCHKFSSPYTYVFDDVYSVVIANLLFLFIFWILIFYFPFLFEVAKLLSFDFSCWSELWSLQFDSFLIVKHWYFCFCLEWWRLIFYLLLYGGSTFFIGLVCHHWLIVLSFFAGLSKRYTFNFLA
jgi:hypothetical protein